MKMGYIVFEGRNKKKNENNSNNEKKSTINYSKNNKSITNFFG